MLILSRKQDEEVLIGRGIRVTVIEISGNRVRLGFTAPDDVKIIRAEIPIPDSFFDEPVKRKAKTENLNATEGEAAKPNELTIEVDV